MRNYGGPSLRSLTHLYVGTVDCGTKTESLRMRIVDMTMGLKVQRYVEFFFESIGVDAEFLSSFGS